MPLSKELIYLMPKTDLHCHLDGSLRPKTLISLAKKNGIDLPSNDGETLLNRLGFGQCFASLEAYIKSFDLMISLLQSKEALFQVAYELCEDAFRENVWHLEIRFCPLQHCEKGLSGEEVVESVLLAIKNAKSRMPLSVGLILCALRHKDPSDSLIVAQLAQKYAQQGVCGFDIAGPEKGFPIKPHIPAIMLARNNYLPITIHAGEAFGAQGILEAIFEGGAVRIGHGTTLIENEKLLQWVIDYRIGIESCPISNVHTRAVSTLAKHPLRKYVEQNVRISINTDNRLVSKTLVSNEIWQAHDQLDLSLKQIKRLLINGFKSAFLPFEKRKQLLHEFEQRWLQIEVASQRK